MARTNPGELGFKLERGWKIRHKAGNGGELLVQKSGPGHIFIRWYLSKSQKPILLPSTPIMHQRRGAAIVAHKKRQLIYWREQGIVGYDLTTKKEKLLVALDNNLFGVGGLWIDNDQDVLYFIREKYYPPRNVIFDELQKTQKSQKFEVKHSPWVYSFKTTYSLLAYSFKNNACRSIVNFRESGSAFLADTRAGLFYCWRKRNIMIADLHSGRVKKMLPEPDIVKLALLPSGNILVWGFHTDIAYQIDSAGRRKASTFKGMFPAYSPDGNHCAFWKRTGKLYLSDAAEKPERLLTPSNFGKDSWTSLQSPTWSSCGRYFATQLDTPDISGRPKISLLVFDLKSKSASIRAQNLLDFVWL